ncbi:F-box-like domain-containing protein [Pochonia chlamydosporia 170]|uniref:F-box-like domain-containing protein n=1 Tax=Pochonia chlamydosporia 170 TaxID=1380566 RepID=A0A179F5N8_METCM|nr:F-box-like domain-containing protein [Pochonia chlamydosporia 170]OAQ60651.2 F-box-like domain-containing protein [Pochonia chlamydosporia 170]
MEWENYMNEEWQGLKSLSETCRRLHTNAQPILFHSLRPRSDQNAFIRLIASRPDLGSWTRQISFSPLVTPFDDDDADDKHFQEQLANYI